MSALWRFCARHLFRRGKTFVC